MFNSKNYVNVQSLLDGLCKKNLIDNTQFKRAQQYINEHPSHQQLSLFMWIIIGIGTILATAFFMAGLYWIIDFTSALQTRSLGIIFIGSAIFIAIRYNHASNMIKHNVLLQFSFCLMLLGKVLFITSGEYFETDTWRLTFATIFITAITYPFYKISLDRFLFSFFSLMLLITSIENDPALAISRFWWFDLLFFVQVFAAGTMLLNNKTKPAFIPIIYAMIFIVCYMVLFTEPHILVNTPFFGIYPINSMSITLLIASLALIGTIGLEKDILKTEPMIVAIITTVLLGIFTSPEIMLVLCLLILGYYKHEHLLLLIGFLLLPFFLFLYYYDLKLTLLTKSIVLISSGNLFLLASAYLSYRQLDSDKG